MKKFLTNNQKIELFDQIVAYYSLDRCELEIGGFIQTTFDALDLKNKWEAYNNTINKDEQQILDAINQGLQICYLDGILYFNSNNKKNGSRTVLSVRAFNKLKEKGRISSGYVLKMYPDDK